MYRKIIIYSNSNTNTKAKAKLKIPKEIKKELAIRKTKIITKIIKNSNSKSKTSSTPRIELYGYDKTLKYTSKNVSTKTLKKYNFRNRYHAYGGN